MAAAAVCLRKCFMLKNVNLHQLTERTLPNAVVLTRDTARGRQTTRSFSVPPATEHEVGTLSTQEKLFRSFRVQHLLSQITSFDPNKVFKPRQQALRPPKYKFMTDEELKQAIEEAENKGYRKLKMPAFLRRTEEAPRVISKDPEFQGLIPNNLVCVDISAGKLNRFRVIVVRQPDGILREATHQERAQVNQIYFPKLGREVEMPSMFQPEHLEAVLKKGDYLFVLERAFHQFDLADPNYSRVTDATFRHIAQMKKFDVLRSTRFFGPMAFYFIIEKKVDDLMIDMIQRFLVEDAVDMVELYCLVHSPDKWKEFRALGDKVQILKAFASEYASKGGELELTIQSLKEHLDKKEQHRN